MKKILTFLAGAALMLVVMVLCAFGAMRLAIHGREIDVPNLAGLSDTDAANTARRLGLELSVENRFYSGATPPNHVLSQSPAAGALVRRGSQVRVTESLGGQQLSMPDVIGQAERPAEVVLKRLQLELGPTAHLPSPLPAGVVMAQSPPPSASGLAGPHVSLLVSDGPSSSTLQGYVMPQIVGMSLSAANAYLAGVGLHINSAQDPQALAEAAALSSSLAADATTGSPQQPSGDPAVPPTVAQPLPPSPNAVIVAQSPAPGHRISRGEAIRAVVAHPVRSTEPDTTAGSTP